MNSKITEQLEASLRDMWDIEKSAPPPRWWSPPRSVVLGPTLQNPS